MVQGLGDTHKEICINTLPLENLIHIRSITANMPSKPGRCTFLSVQFLFDALSDVHILLCRQKKDRIVCILSSVEAPPSAFARISTNNSCPYRHELLRAFFSCYEIWRFSTERTKLKAQYLFMRTFYCYFLSCFCYLLFYFNANLHYFSQFGH